MVQKKHVIISTDFSIDIRNVEKADSFHIDLLFLKKESHRAGNRRPL